MSYRQRIVEGGPARLATVWLALALTGCHHKPVFVLNAKGDKHVDMTKDFVMTQGGVVQNGKCAPTAFPMSSPQVLSSTLAAFLGHNGYCLSAIVEYQDDQRIIVPAGTGGNATYGSRISMFANPWLVNYKDSTEFERDWINVAIIYVSPSGSTAVPDGYAALHLALGENCLFIHFDAKGPIRRWQAAMVTAKTNECVPQGGPNEPDESQKLFFVAPEQPSDLPEDYPAVPRIHEGKHNSVLLGVRCGNIWCVIGTKNAADIEPPAREEEGAGAYPTRRSHVRGWFDDQRLGVKPADTSKPIVPSDQRGSVVPVRDSLTLR